MRLLVLEAVCAGLCGESSSLLREGAAMWRALVEDLLAVPGFQVLTCLAAAMRPQLSLPDGVECFWSSQSAEWSAWWDDAVAATDAVLVIAPETCGLLHDLVASAGAKSLNCTPAAIALCTDKLRLAGHLIECGVPTIPTRMVDWSAAFDARDCPAVIKPRDGAGCERTFLIRNSGERDFVFRAYAQNPEMSALMQPYRAGTALSVAGLFASAHQTLFPIAEQAVTCDAPGRRLAYQGGRIPARIAPSQAEAVRALVLRAASTVSGLRGYVGFDVILPHESQDQPLLVEINPRLTTSYIGYRRLCEQNLAAALPGLVNEPLTWRNQVVEFDVSGAEISSRSTAG